MNYEIIEGGIIDQQVRGENSSPFYWTLHLTVLFDGVTEPVEFKLYNPEGQEIINVLDEYANKIVIPEVVPLEIIVEDNIEEYIIIPSSNYNSNTDEK